MAVTIWMMTMSVHDDDDDDDNDVHVQVTVTSRCTTSMVIVTRRPTFLCTSPSPTSEQI